MVKFSGLFSFVNHVVLLSGILLSGWPVAFAQPESSNTFNAAQALEDQGRYDDAFGAYLNLSGGEYAAAVLARNNPNHFLDLLNTLREKIPTARLDLIRAELLLILNNNPQALELFRKVAQEYPAADYPVYITDAEYKNFPAKPFTIGPGSQSDNWLIQRFIALGAMADAENEFERIWSLHQSQKQFNGPGLRFALDYAYFLKGRGKNKEALDVLLKPWLSLDLEHNPNWGLSRQDFWGMALPGMASRKEFMRLSFGFIKDAGAEAVLEEKLLQSIANGNNNSRRTLAFLRLLQGRLDHAMQLELEFIRQGSFNPLSAAYRRGMVYESFTRPQEAAAEYEKVLVLPWEELQQPDKDEEDMQKQMFSQALMVDREKLGKDHLYNEIFQRLQRLYNSLGQTDKAAKVALRQFEVNPYLLDRLEVLEQTARNFQAAGKEKEFSVWLEQKLSSTQSHLSQANISWLLNDYVSASKHIALYSKKNGPSSAQPWKERFRGLGQEWLKTLLMDLVRENPEDTTSRLELLDLEKKENSRDLIPIYESLLKKDTTRLFPEGKGIYNKTEFRNPYDLAYRLMRLYEKAGRFQELKSLGLRVARAEQPFQKWPEDLKNDQYRYRDHNDFPEDLNLCFSLLIQYADDEVTQSQIESALDTNPYEIARHQLERHKNNPAIEQPRPVFPWGNVPSDALVLASNENILSLAFDDKYIYAGLPWGLSVYTLNGKPVTRLGLGTAALVLALQGDIVWIGAPDGLYSVKRDHWQEIGYLALDQDLNPRDRHPDDKYFDNDVGSLAVDNDVLWIGTRRNIKAYHPAQKTLEVYSEKDLGVSTQGDWGRFIIDESYIWADGYQGLRRFDKRTQKWEAVEYKNSEVHLLGLLDGQLWGNVNLGEPLRSRPCLIDRQTRQVTPIFIAGNLTRDEQCINGPFSFVSKIDGQMIFTDKYRFYFWDPSIQQLRLSDLAKNQVMSGVELMYSGRWQISEGLIQYINDIDHNQKLFGKIPFKAGEWQSIDLKNGSLILGSKTTRSPRYQYPDEDWPEEYETDEAEGGLFLIEPATPNVQRLSSGFAGSLAGDNVFKAFADKDGSLWVTTSAGIDHLDQDLNIMAHYSRKDGLLSNRITDGAIFNDRIYFASGWNDSGGGLIIFDPKTRVFTARIKSDGLPTDKLETVRPENGQLKLEFLSEYQRFHNGNYLLSPSAFYNPASDSFISTGEPKPLEQNAAQKDNFVPPKDRQPMPYLGGSVINRIQLGDKTFLCGTRGLVVLKHAPPAGLDIKPIEARIVSSQDQEWIKEARTTPINIQNANDLRRYVASPNGYIRAQAVSTLLGKAPAVLEASMSILANLVTDTNYNVRTTLVFLLTRMPFRGAQPLLTKFLDDPDLYIRGIAACTLAANSVRPDFKYIKEIFEYPIDRFGNLPFGPESTIGVELTEEKVYSALASQADAPVFELMLQHPISYYKDETRDRIFDQLGESLRRAPKAAWVLLKAYSVGAHQGRQENFAKQVLQSAGKDLLPTLHAALDDPDRIVRSNAARACGVLADPSSVQPLIKALDLESGLSRASIVWALGQLRAREALPALIELYIMAKQDEDRHAGHRMAQQRAQLDTQYTVISDLDKLHSTTDQMAVNQTLKPVVNLNEEQLLSSREVLEAIQNIDINATREFYFKLAGTSDVAARIEGAVSLGKTSREKTEHDQSVPVLHGLLSDADTRVRLEAAVSLLILDDAISQKYILEGLNSSNEWEKTTTLRALLRVKDYNKLVLFKAALEKCADTINADTYLKKEWQPALKFLQDK